jgi:hypothetical protein
VDGIDDMGSEATMLISQRRGAWFNRGENRMNKEEESEIL